MTEDERRERAEKLEANRRMLRELQVAWGFGADEQPVGRIAKTARDLSSAVEWTARHRYARDPDALRWLGLTLDYWAQAMRTWAEDAEAGIAAWAAGLDASEAIDPG